MNTFVRLLPNSLPTRKIALGVTIFLLVGCETSVRTNSKVDIVNTGSETCYYEERSVAGARSLDLNAVCSTPGFTGVLPKRARLEVPLDALSVGVSQFEPQAGATTTPAHTISAILFSRMLAELRNNAATHDGRLRYAFEHTRYSSADSRVEELARLLVAPNDKSLPVADLAKAVAELGRMPIPPAMVGHSPDKPWFYQQGLPVTKERFHAALDAQAARVLERKTPLVLLYLASHGIVSPDGNAYVLWSNSAHGDFTTMTTYSVLVDHYAKLATQMPETVFVVVLDTCQTFPESGEPPGFGSLPPIPSNLLVVTASSPGEYAWHWRLARVTRAMKFDRIAQPSDSAPALGLPWYLSSTPSSESKTAYLSQMSPLAIAFAASIQSCEQQLPGASVPVARWLNHATRVSQELIKDIPERKSYTQTVRQFFTFNPQDTNPRILQLTC